MICFRPLQWVIFFGILTLGSSFSDMSYAKVYKFKDKNGDWQFSDKPPIEDKTIVEVISTQQSESKASSALPEDLEKVLSSLFPVDTPVEKSTLSVISIKTPLGGGTGFFVSQDGYIVTNRHVIRPTTTPQWEKSNKEYLRNLETLKAQEENLKRRTTRLKAMSVELTRYRVRIEGDGSKIEGVAFSDFRLYEDRYKGFKQELADSKKEYKKNKKIVDKQKKDFHFASTLSRTKKRFDIQLKNNAVLNADLVIISKNFDLALLKIKGHKTPYINIRNNIVPSQGSKAYAIGSPLGLRDFVTFGSITHVRSDMIMTDTQILPGNSGGPLIDTQGRIIGVNTQKLMADESIGSAGFGIAIPIKYVISEFGDLFDKK